MKDNILILKPCPFCGENVNFSGDDEQARIVCFNPECIMLNITFMASFKDFKSLAKQWNTRINN